MRQRIEIHVFGAVQGIFFRSDTEKLARALGLTGWVRNEKDGSVTIVAEGDEEQLKELAGWCQKGNARSRVERADIDFKSAGGEFTGFEIRH